MKPNNSEIAHAVWRDAGCGEWKPDPSDVVDVVGDGWIVWIVLTDGAWPMPWERLERLVNEARGNKDEAE